MLNEDLLPYFAKYERLMRFYIDREDGLNNELSVLSSELQKLKRTTFTSIEQRETIYTLLRWIKERYISRDTNEFLMKTLNCKINTDWNVFRVSGYETELNTHNSDLIFDNIITFRHINNLYKQVENLIIEYKQGSKRVKIGNEDYLYVEMMRFYGCKDGYITSIPYTKDAMKWIIRRG